MDYSDADGVEGSYLNAEWRSFYTRDFDGEVDPSGKQLVIYEGV